jgi:hypothetical protein
MMEKAEMTKPLKAWRLTVCIVGELFNMAENVKKLSTGRVDPHLKRSWNFIRKKRSGN